MTRPVDRPHLKTGAKRKRAPTGIAPRIEALAADGFSIVGIAGDLGIVAHTLNRWLDDDPALREAFDKGRERERHTLHNMLYRAAMENNNASAAMFLLKSRHGCREGDQSEAGNRVSIVFQLPGAMSMDAFQTIEHGPTDKPADGDRDQRVSTARTTLARGS